MEPKQEAYYPFELHKELALDSRNHRDPEVRIELPFDISMFEGGLKKIGFHKGTSMGREVFGIETYQNLLVPLLGKNWHIRAINAQMDVLRQPQHSGLL